MLGLSSMQLPLYPPLVFVWQLSEECYWIQRSTHADSLFLWLLACGAENKPVIRTASTSTWFQRARRNCTRKLLRYLFPFGATVAAHGMACTRQQKILRYGTRLTMCFSCRARRGESFKWFGALSKKQNNCLIISSLLEFEFQAPASSSAKSSNRMLLLILSLEHTFFV
jgi:hypothetical protein